MKKYLNLCIFFIFSFPGLHAQVNEADNLSAAELDRLKVQVGDLVAYFEGTVNFIGDPKSATREKEIILNDSYLKLFRDEKVQVEDDLDESREVSLHKDVQAYLKDIEFFFRTVKFSFVISDITFNTSEGGVPFFKVTLNRDLQGITVAGDTVANRKVRFMEINLDVANNDLRIVSLYTTKLNEREEIRNWWNGLPGAWKNLFGSQVTVYDSLKLSDVYFIADSLLLLSREPGIPEVDSSLHFDVEVPVQRQEAIHARMLDSIYVNTGELYNKLSGLLKQTRVDISGNQQIRSLEPLSELSDLTEFYCSHTLVVNLFPLRNLNRLQVLDVSNTPVADLSPLKYSTSLKSLDCSYTLIEDLSAVMDLYSLEKMACAGLRIHSPGFARGMPDLRELNLRETAIHDLSEIKGLTRLVELDVSYTNILDFEDISSFSNLRFLNAEGTSVSNTGPLTSLLQLEVLRISYTAVESLQPLVELPGLKRIYWDSSGDFPVDRKRKKEEALAFLDAHPESLVIFETEALMNGWKDLEEPWKIISRNAVSLSDNPTNEELHAVLQLEELEIDMAPVTTMKPIANLYNLRKLSARGVQVSDFSPVAEAIELEFLDLSDTPVKTLEFARSLNHLEELRIEGTGISDLSPLHDLKGLRFIYADNTGVADPDVKALRARNPECLILYKTGELQQWWETLPGPWKDFFVSGFTLHSPPSKEQLHQLYYLEKLEIEKNPEIVSYQPVRQLVNLKVVKFNQLVSGDLAILAELRGLTELHCTGMPVTDLAAVASLGNLEVLNLENTPVADLKPLASLISLKHLNLSGTQVSSLKPLSDLTRLESVEINNTQVKKISPLYSLPSLAVLSCFNTRVSSKNIDKFREEKPECKVVYY